MGYFNLISAGIFMALGIYDIKHKKYGWAALCAVVVILDLYQYFN